jgi:hypothetical protein
VATKERLDLPLAFFRVTLAPTHQTSLSPPGREPPGSLPAHLRVAPARAPLSLVGVWLWAEGVIRLPVISVFS